MKKILKSILFSFYWVVNLPTFLLYNITIGKKCHFQGRIFVRTRRGGSITLEDNVNINSSLASNAIGGGTKTIFNAAKGGKIIIKRGVGLSNTAIVSAVQVTIDEYSNIGAGTKIYDTDFHSLRSDIRLNGDYEVRTKPVYIGKRVFIGAHCIILKGVNIGDSSVIGAGSVVTHNIPAGEIWAGNPARFIRKVIQ